MRRDLHTHEETYLERIRTRLSDPVPGWVRIEAESYARNLMENGLPVLFDQQHLAVVTGVPSQTIGLITATPERYYSRFRIPKRSSGSRPIAAPTPNLKRVQHWIQRHLASNLWSHPACHGFVPGRSIVTNASRHVRAPLIYKFDVRDFFGSVKRGRVYGAFRRVGYSREVARLLTALTTLDGRLPQGAPTSPPIANFLAYGLDARLSTFAERNGLTYTRYADDLTFSAEWRPRRTFRRTVEHIMRQEGFPPRDDKLRILRPHYRQAVTGLVVNDKLNFPRERRRWLRQEVYYLRRFGVDSHLQRRGQPEVPGYKEFIYGHVYALNSVRPEEAAKHLTELDAVAWPY